MFIRSNSIREALSNPRLQLQAPQRAASADEASAPIFVGFFAIFLKDLLKIVLAW